MVGETRGGEATARKTAGISFDGLETWNLDLEQLCNRRTSTSTLRVLCRSTLCEALLLFSENMYAHARRLDLFPAQQVREVY